jgi:uncharacterized protein (DUF1015 family)
MLRPTTARLVRQEVAGRVVSPPYDALTVSERSALAEREPLSWLNVTMSPADLSDRLGREVGDDDAAAQNRAAYERLDGLDAFTGGDRAVLYVYELAAPDHTQVGVVGAIGWEAVDTGLVRGHERTRPARAATLTTSLRRTGVVSSPVMVGVRTGGTWDAAVDRVTATEPALVVDHPGALHQRVWRVADEAAVAALSDAVGPGPYYIVDGHHRVAASRQDRLPAVGLWSAVFPLDSLRASSFPRLLATTLDAVEAVLPTSAAAAPAAAPPTGTVLLTDGERWRSGLLHPEAGEIDVLRLVRLLPETPMEPLAAGMAADDVAAEARRAGGVGAVLGAVPIEAVVAAADSGRPLPPKSTYFHPKVRSGVFVLPIAGTLTS